MNNTNNVSSGEAVEPACKEVQLQLSGLTVVRSCSKGGVAMPGASKILASPERGGSDPCQDFSGQFDLQYS